MVASRTNKNSGSRRTSYKCMRCGSRSNLNLHHFDYNPLNNDPNNLKCLCLDCHMHYHLGRGYADRRSAGLEIPDDAHSY